MKIGIVGLGYWGKIILKNLKELDYSNIIVCEERKVDWTEFGTKYQLTKNYKKLKCDKVFVLTPASTHFEICKHFLSKGIDVFCEKPLDLDFKNCEYLFNLAKNNNCNLFVDWLFTFNNAVKKIKNLTKEWGKPKNIIMNRMNYGPFREDVNARWDLASHDVSICSYILDELPLETKWIDFKRDFKSNQEDSVVGILNFSKTTVQINSSWNYGMKNRMCIFEFDNGFLYWDDTTQSIMYNSETLDFEKKSPLHNSIDTFLNKKFNLEEMTLNVTKILSV